MIPIMDLWLPILISAVAVFVASSIIWMALPIHKKDYQKLDKEGEVVAAVRGWGIAPGMYMFPACEHGSMKDPEVKRKMKEGPIGTLTVMRMPQMGQMMGLWALNLLITSALVGLLASWVFPPGRDFSDIFRFTALAAFLAYGGNVLTDSIWKGRPWRVFPGAVFDAVVYAAITGAIFAWKWPPVVVGGTL